MTITSKPAYQTRPTVMICLNVLMNDDLHAAYCQHVHNKMIASVREDRPNYELMLNLAGEQRYDQSELADLLMSRAGFQSSIGGLGVVESPTECSDFTI